MINRKKCQSRILYFLQTYTYVVIWFLTYFQSMFLKEKNKHSFYQWHQAWTFVHTKGELRYQVAHFIWQWCQAQALLHI